MECSRLKTEIGNPAPAAWSGFVPQCAAWLGIASRVLALLLAGCRLDMHLQPKYLPYEPTNFFPDGRSERPARPGNCRARPIAPR